ncbi:hypothetical protein FORC54_2911 [Vibrio vulnificus]|uniref:Uncharacterized protein n=1 Tax=Vibrio vulnificus TaxID=672 RepID=A0AAN1PKM8_VIBVL|nr:hypothetical protein FORC54_2911 [Vibrio vulnificus]AXX58409.1 hypothetical protein FORC53_0070 [Vibrio vulnificus]
MIGFSFGGWTIISYKDYKRHLAAEFEAVFCLSPMRFVVVKNAAHLSLPTRMEVLN